MYNPNIKVLGIYNNNLYLDMGNTAIHAITISDSDKSDLLFENVFEFESWEHVQATSLGMSYEDFLLYCEELNNHNLELHLKEQSSESFITNQDNSLPF